MATSGTFEIMNKVRPGAYVKFITLKQQEQLVGTGRPVAVATELNWGPTGELIYITSNDLQDTTAFFNRFGYLPSDPEVASIVLALSGTQEGYFYRLGTGGAKATKTDSDPKKNVVATAKYPGLLGNGIEVEYNNSRKEVSIFVRGNLAVQKRFTDSSELYSFENDFVDFSKYDGTKGDPSEDFDLFLVDGTNGSIIYNSEIPAFLDLLHTVSFDTVVVEDRYQVNTSIDDARKEIIVSRVNSWRKDYGKKVRTVFFDLYESGNSNRYNNEAVILVHQGFTMEDGREITPAQAAIWVAGFESGALSSTGLTSKVIDGATRITEFSPTEDPQGFHPVVKTDLLTNDEIITALNEGRFIFTYRVDGVAVIEKDINSYVIPTDTKGVEFKKNRLIRCLDGISQGLQEIFNNNYSGQKANTAVNRNLLLNDFISFLNEREADDSILDFNPVTDIEVKLGPDSETLVADIYVKPTDSITKIYMTVYLSNAYTTE